jgi:hypothetical protein
MNRNALQHAAKNEESSYVLKKRRLGLGSFNPLEDMGYLELGL